MYTQFFEVRSRLNLPLDKNAYEVSAVYQKKLKEVEVDETTKKYLQWDYELMACFQRQMILEGYSGSRLTPYIEFGDYVFPDIHNFEADRVPFYEACVSQTENRFMRARYLDYLVDHCNGKSKYRYALQLMDELFALCVPTDNRNKEFISMASRLVDVGMKFKKTDLLKRAEHLLVEKALLLKNEEFVCVFWISDLLIHMHKKEFSQLDGGTSHTIARCLERARSYYQQITNHWLYRDASQQYIKWLRACKRPIEDIKAVQMEIGEAFEREAETQEKLLIKIKMLQEAVQFYALAGAKKKKTELLAAVKKLLREYENIDELLCVPFEIVITKDKIDEIVEPYRSLSPEDALSLVSYKNFFPPQKMVRENNLFNSSVFLQLVDVMSFSHGLTIYDSKSGNSKDFWFDESYGLYVDVNFKLGLESIWDQLLENGVTEQMVTDRITSWKYMAPNSKPIVQRGIERFFAGDYISAIHILVPQFENSLRILFEHGGYATTTFKEDMTQEEQTFSKFLQNDFVKQHLGEDLFFFVCFVMTKDTGLNLRNEVAHGLISPDRLDKSTALMVLYLFLKLSCFQWVPEKQSNSPH